MEEESTSERGQESEQKGAGSKQNTRGGGVAGERSPRGEAVARARPDTRALTGFEAGVIARVSEGLSDEQIARILDSTVGAVRYAVRGAVVKLGALNRPHAVALAIGAGVVRLDTSDIIANRVPGASADVAVHPRRATFAGGQSQRDSPER